MSSQVELIELGLAIFWAAGCLSEKDLQLQQLSLPVWSASLSGAEVLPTGWHVIQIKATGTTSSFAPFVRLG